MMKEQKVERVFVDKASENTKGKEFKEMMAFVRTGEIAATETMKGVGLRPNTFYRRAKIKL